MGSNVSLEVATLGCDELCDSGGQGPASEEDAEEGVRDPRRPCSAEGVFLCTFIHTNHTNSNYSFEMVIRKNIKQFQYLPEFSNVLKKGRRQDLGLGGFQFKCSVDLFPLFRRRRSQKIS